MALAVTANPVPGMADAYAACMARGQNTRAPWLWDGLVGLWLPSVGIQGGRLIDWSGHHNHGTLTNMDPATDWVGTWYGWGLDFDGSDDYVTGLAPVTTYPLSIAIWGVTGAAGTSRFINIGDASHATNYWALDIDIGNDWSYWFRSGGNESIVVAGSPTANTAYFMAAVSPASDAHSLYVDGILAGTDNTLSTPTNVDIFGLGALVRATPIYTDCQVIQAMAWSRALSAAEIRALAADPFLMIRPAVDILPGQLALPILPPPHVFDVKGAFQWP